MESVVPDQMGERVRLSGPPKRIISLVPSQTELLFDLGLDPVVIGITKFCVHPHSWFSTKAKVGGTKDLWFDRIQELQPDLIIGNKEENDRQSIERLKADFPVWMSDVSGLEDALAMVGSLGALCHKRSEAARIIDQIRLSFDDLRKAPPLRVLYLIWKGPWMGAGQNTFIHAMLEQNGLVNCLRDERYPELSDQDIARLNPDLVLLPSEPFPFSEKNKPDLHKILPDAKMLLVDGQMFSWYGSRMIQAVPYFGNLFKGLSRE